MASKPERQGTFDSILGKARRDTTAGNVRHIGLEQIQLNPQQPRKHFDEHALEQLTESVREEGVLQPVLVRPLAEGFELVAGERRYRAAQRAGLGSIPAVIREIEDQQLLELALMENLNREDLNPVEETESMLELLGLILNKSSEEVASIVREGYYQSQGRETVNTGVYSAELAQVQSVFQRLGRFTISSFYTHRMAILRLPEALLASVRRGHLDYSKAKLLARVEPPALQQALTERAIQENLSRSDLQEAIKQSRAPETGEPEGEIHIGRYLGSFKRKLSSKTVESLKPAKQRRLLALMQQMENLLKN